MCPMKTWTTVSDFAEGTHVGTECTENGKLKLEAAETDGYWESQVYEASSWQHWSQFNMEVTRPTGTVVVYRFRSGTTSGNCEAADWSPWMDDFDSDGNVSASIFAWYLNKLEEDPSYSHGQFWQVQVRLVKE